MYWNHHLPYAFIIRIFLQRNNFFSLFNRFYVFSKICGSHSHWVDYQLWNLEMRVTSNWSWVWWHDRGPNPIRIGPQGAPGGVLEIFLKISQNLIFPQFFCCCFLGEVALKLFIQFDNQLPVILLAIRLWSLDQKHLIPGNGPPKLQGKHVFTIIPSFPWPLSVDLTRHVSRFRCRRSRNTM